MTKYGLGYISGDFYKQASGHPDPIRKLDSSPFTLNVQSVRDQQLNLILFTI
jgi:hypothetical protein